MMRKKCEACNKVKLPKDHATVYVGDHPFNVCDECEKLLVLILQKFEEREQDYEQSLSVPRDDQ
jgi:hypothetical protein